MFTVTENGSNRVDLELGGKLDSEEMRALLKAIIDKSQGVTNGQMLYRLQDFDFPSLGAIAVELGHLPELFRLIKRFDRVAVLCEKNWVRKIGEIEGALIPGLEIKSFDIDAVQEAEDWLAA